MLCWGGKRHHMKLEDKEIEKERERERELERQTSQDNPIPDIIQHFFHPHQLSFTEPDYAVYSCNVCKRNTRGKRYHCSKCKFDLHKVCAQSPLTWLLHQMPPEEIENFGVRLDIINSFAHPQHKIVAEYRKKPFRCDHCYSSGDGIRYCCNSCKVTFHQVCATHPTRLTSDLHPQHELELMLRPYFKSCDLCWSIGGPKNNRMYRCKQCDFYLHPGCSQWPLYLVHPLHPPHPLVLKQQCGEYSCSACGEVRDGSKYSCTLCGLDFDRVCIRQKSILGLDNEVRQSYADQKITLLPISNLTSTHIPLPLPPSVTSD